MADRKRKRRRKSAAFFAEGANVTRDSAALRNLARAYVQGILTRFRQDDFTLAHLKAEPPALIEYVFDRVKLLGCPERRYAGPITPKSYKDFSPIVPAAEALSLSDEIRWSSILLTRQGDAINQFLADAGLFESALVAGDVPLARITYDRLLHDRGHSLWAIEAGALLADCEGGLTANRQFSTSVSEETDDAYADIVARFASTRVEAGVSAATYRQSVTSTFLPDFPFTKDSHVGIAYLLFRSDHYGPYDYSDNQLRGIINLESTYSLIDRYNAFVRVLLVLACRGRLSGMEELSDTLLDRMANSIADSRLYALRHYVRPSAPHADDGLRRHLLVARDAYVRGDYGTAARLSAEGLQIAPTALEFYTLHVRAHIHLGTTPAALVRPGSIQTRILSQVDTVLRRKDDAQDALEALLKLAYMFSFSRLGDQLFAFATENAAVRSHLDLPLLRSLTGIALGPEFAARFPTASQGREFLTAVGGLGSGPMHDLYTAMLRDEAPPADPTLLTTVPGVLRALYFAKWLEGRERTVEARELYQRVADLGGNDVLFEMEAKAGAFRCDLALGEYEPAAATAIDAYFNRPGMVTGLPLDDLIDAYSVGLRRRRNVSLLWPVLYLAYYRLRGLARDNKILFVLHDQFLSSNGLERPSQLAETAGQFPRHLLITFLRHVCVREVLDSSMVYSSTQEMENERVEVCRLVSSLDPGVEDDEREISRLTQNRGIRAALHAVQHSKVYVDLPGIRRSLDRSFEEEFSRYLMLRGLEQRLRQSYLEVGDPILGRKQKKRAALVYVDESLHLFRELFTVLHGKYTSSSEYGLDSYLSLRIRHHIIEGHLRAPFEAKHLVTTRTGNADVYQTNLYWQKHFEFLAPDEWKAVDRRFSRFSRVIDQASEEVKNEWIQIRSDIKPVGLFDLAYEDEELGRLYAVFSGVNTLDEFIDAVFAELNSRTDAALGTIRDAIKGRLMDLFLTATSELEADIVAVHPAIRSTAFPAAVNQCRTDVQQDLEAIAAWFRSVGDSRGTDAPLSHLVEAVLKHIRRSEASDEVVPEVVIAGDAICPGAAFAYLFDAFHILLTNASGHADENPPLVRARIEADGGRARIVVRNRMGVSADVAALQARAEELERRANQPATDAVKREKGTGYYKLARLMKINLRHLTPAVRVDVREEDGRGYFEATIEFDARVPS